MKSFLPPCLAVLLLASTIMAAPPEAPGQQTVASAKTFRLVFSAYDGDPRKDKPETFSFQINTIDFRQPSEFLRLGERIPNTKLKLSRFEYKMRWGANVEGEDTSELTVTNVDTGESTVLVLQKVTNVPSARKP